MGFAKINAKAGGVTGLAFFLAPLYPYKRNKSPVRIDILKGFNSGLVPVKGLEPPLPFEKRILSPSRLPFRHTGIYEVEDGAP